MTERNEIAPDAKRPIDRLVITLCMAKARFRAASGFCPMCNSDAPELDNCPLCGGYSAAKGDKFPPPKAVKKAWLDEYKGVLVTKRKIKALVRESRRKRQAL